LAGDRHLKKSSLSPVFSLKWLEKQPESFVKSMVFLNISPYYGIIDIANKTLIVPHRKMCVPVYSPNCGSL